MAKIRVHDLAKELGMESKELVDILKSKNIEAKSQSTLEDDWTTMWLLRSGRKQPEERARRRKRRRLRRRTEPLRKRRISRS